MEILNALATTDVLIGSIISELDLRDSHTGNPLSVQQLADMMEVNSQALGQRSGQPGSHLFNLIVEGDTSELLKSIADEWARLFVEQSSLLFVTKTLSPPAVGLEQHRGRIRTDAGTIAVEIEMSSARHPVIEITCFAQ